MAWTHPKTWVAGAVVGAAELNTHLRDNLRVLKTAVNQLGRINFEAATELTIAAGVVTAVRNVHTLDTEGDAASDDLDTITAGSAVAEGFLLTVLVEHTARAVVLKDGTGNLALGRDLVLNSANHMAVLVYDGTNWRAVTMAGGIKSIQRGTIAIAAGTGVSATATIAAVNTAKAVLLSGGWTGVPGSSAPGVERTKIVLTNATTVTATRVGADSNTNQSVVAYQVVEFY